MKFPQILRNTDEASGAAGGGAEDGAAGAGSGGEAAGASGESQQPAGGASGAVSPYRPEGLPDHLAGTTEKETIEKLWNGYKGARDKIAHGGDVPAEAAGYTFEPSDAVKPYAESLATDPLFGAAREIALKHGLSNKAFGGFMNDIMAAMIDGGGVIEPFSAEKELETLLPDVTDPAARKTQGEKLSRDAIALLDVFKQQGAPEAAIEFLKLNLDRAVAIQLVNWMGSRPPASGEIAPALGGKPGGAGISREELKKRDADPRNNYDSGKYDPDFAAETTRLYALLDKPA